MLRLTRLLPRDKNMRWEQTDVFCQQPHRFTTGAWNRGPMTGVTLTTRSHPWVTSVLTSIVSTWDATLSFSTVTLTLNVAAHPHRDMFNHCDSRNMAMPLSRFIGGELFVESPDGLTQLSPDGPRGHTLDLSAPTSFPPRALHASLPWWGARLLLLAYHIGQSSRISEVHRGALQRLGFALGFF